jgi:cytochrome b pre-mRNA-processing protein 3
MIFQLFRRTAQDDSIARLYGAIVAQARAEAFYRDYGVPDSVNGRFEMVLLHAILLLERLDRAGGTLRQAGQGVFDLFCRDMDANLRELGVGDQAVPRQMRRVGEAFYGRRAAYAAADAAALAAALGRNVFGVAQPAPAGAARLTAYVAMARTAVAAQDSAAFERGEVSFPDPENVMVHDGDHDA